MSNHFDDTRVGVPSGTVTFLFTDIENSSRLAQQYSAAMPALLERHHAILNRSIQARHGFVFQIVGDAFCAAFHNASEALHAALAAQQAIQHEPWEAAPVAVRMGIHTGAAEAGETDDRSGGYRGYLAMARVQSIMSSAHGGQVLLSGASAELVRNHLPAGVSLRDMGEHQLKGGLNPEHLWQMVAEGLQVDFPPLKTLSEIPNNLPVQLNSFVGREHELAQTKEMLASAHLLTLIGPGGTGKTRLTLQLAAEVLPEFADGVWLVELAPLADSALVLQTIAATLGVREIPGVPLESLVAGFLHAKHLLLILDNCEHLVETCALLAGQLLRGSPNLRLIASSREALGVAGETVYRVPPLALPVSDGFALETLHGSEAVQLFVERAAAVKPGFSLSERNGPAVAQICRRLDGIPLALELAAARVAMLTPEQITARLDDRFRLLTGGSRTAMPRQQTLRSLIDWSYDLLPEQERLLFCQLAVFVGGWSLDAAEAVCPELDVLALLTQLVQKSLVVAEEGEAAAQTRFRLLETIRQYARDRLFETEAVTQVRDRHLDYYLKFAEAGEPNFFGPGRVEWADQCELELDNFRAALQWGLEYNLEAALRLSGSLTTFWGTRGINLEGRRWLQAALDRAAILPEPDAEGRVQWQAARAKALWGISQMAYADGEYKSALDASQKAAFLYRQVGDPFGLAFALCAIGNMAAFQNDMALAEQALGEAIRMGREMGSHVILGYALGVLSDSVALPQGDFAAARSYAEESMVHIRAAGLSWGVGRGEQVLARIAKLQGDWAGAKAHALAALDISREQHDPLLLNGTYNELGDISLLSGSLQEAQQYLQQCIVGFQQLSQKAFVSHELESFAFLAHRQNRPERTARLLSAAEAVREGIGTSALGIERLEAEFDGAVAWLHAQLDEAAFDTLWSEGCAMTMDQAVAYALEG